jgi:hypothetical protein
MVNEPITPCSHPGTSVFGFPLNRVAVPYMLERKHIHTFTWFCPGFLPSPPWTGQCLKPFSQQCDFSENGLTLLKENITGKKGLTKQHFTQPSMIQPPPKIVWWKSALLCHQMQSNCFRDFNPQGKINMNRVQTDNLRIIHVKIEKNLLMVAI